MEGIFLKTILLSTVFLVEILLKLKINRETHSICFIVYRIPCHSFATAKLK